MIYTGIYTGYVLLDAGTGGFHWWAVEVSNLRPQQCECQKQACYTSVSLGNGALDGQKTAQTGSKLPRNYT